MTITLWTTIKHDGTEMERLKLGFRSRNQLPWVMLWREYWIIDIAHATVIYKSN